jgi:hypothetical protein
MSVEEKAFLWASIEVRNETIEEQQLQAKARAK